MIYSTDPSFVKGGNASNEFLVVSTALQVKLGQFGQNIIKTYVEKLEDDVKLEVQISPAYRIKAKKLRNSKAKFDELVSNAEVATFIEKMMKYFEIALTHLNATTHKSVVSNLPYQLTEELYGKIMAFFSKNAELIQFLEEDPELEQKREDIKKFIERLRAAKEISHRGMSSSYENQLRKSPNDPEL